MRGCRPLTNDEIPRITNAFTGRNERRDRAFFILGLKSGLRCQELLGLRLCDVWAGKVTERVYVRRAVTKGKRTGFSFPLHPAAASALKAYITRDLQDASPNAPLFRSAKRSQNGSARPLDRSGAYRRLKRAFRTAGLCGNLGTHSMRKTFAQTIYDRLGHDLIAAQAALHHRSITSTCRYLSFDQQQVEAAILAA